MRTTLEITTKASCPIRCSFCPQDKLKGAYKGEEKELTAENFDKILAAIPKDCEVHFSGFVEPLINAAAPFYIYQAKAAGFKVELYTTLVGLTETGLEVIARIPLDYVRIHVPDRKAMIIPDAKWISFHAIWRQREIYCTYMAMGPRTDHVQEYLTALGIAVDDPTMLSRGGNLWERTRIEGKLKCNAERWHQNVIMPNGDVYLCCMAYDMRDYLGNLFNQPYADIYHNAEMIRAKAEQGQAPELCRQCEWAQAL